MPYHTSFIRQAKPKKYICVGQNPMCVGLWSSGNKIKTRQASSAIFTINYRALPHTDFTKSTAKQPPASSVKWNIHPSSLQNLKQKTSLFEL